MKIFITTLLVCCTFFFSTAQSEQRVEISDIKKTDDHIEIIISSDKDFYVGGNIYVLHIGNLCIKHSKHPDGNIRLISFKIPIDEYKTLEKGEEIILVYGYHEENLNRTTDIKGRHWRVGKTEESFNNK